MAHEGMKRFMVEGSKLEIGGRGLLERQDQDDF